MTETRPAPLAPVSWGELLDKITILEIKAERIANPAARANVARELSLLRETAAPVLPQPDLAPLLDGLRRVNAALWDIEDDIRAHEAAGVLDFGQRRQRRRPFGRLDRCGGFPAGGDRGADRAAAAHQGGAGADCGGRRGE